MAYKVHCVEDHPVNLRLLYKMLAGEAEKVLEADCGAYLSEPDTLRSLSVRMNAYLFKEAGSKCLT